MFTVIIAFHMFLQTITFFYANSVATNEDIFNRLMVSSDPLISSTRKPAAKKNVSFRKEVIEFLKEPVVANEMPYSSNDEEANDTLS